MESDVSGIGSYKAKMFLYEDELFDVKLDSNPVSIAAVLTGLHWLEPAATSPSTERQDGLGQWMNPKGVQRSMDLWLPIGNSIEPSYRDEFRESLTFNDDWKKDRYLTYT